MFKYIGNMHGNEPVGRQMLIYLAKYLAQNYGKDERITRLLKNTEIFLLPSLNPDGYEASRVECGENRLGRTTANGLDLNNDFDLNSTSGHEPETTAIMQWIKDNPFVLSGDIHGGYMTVTYPYLNEVSSDKNRTDDGTFWYLAETFVNSSRPLHQHTRCRYKTNYNDTMIGRHDYKDITSMKRFNYWTSNCMELQIDISCCKHPPVSHLPRYWMENKESLLAFMEKTHIGVKGLVTDINGLLKYSSQAPGHVHGHYFQH